MEHDTLKHTVWNPDIELMILKQTVFNEIQISNLWSWSKQCLRQTLNTLFVVVVASAHFQLHLPKYSKQRRIQSKSNLIFWMDDFNSCSLWILSQLFWSSNHDNKTTTNWQQKYTICNIKVHTCTGIYSAMHAIVGELVCPVLQIFS